MAGISTPAAAIAIEATPVPAAAAENFSSRKRRPPAKNAAPSTSRRLPMIDPVIDDRTTSSSPSATRKMPTMSSAALPNVALSRPPTRGPEWMASSSVASPRRPARGTMAAAATANRAGSEWNSSVRSESGTSTAAPTAADPGFTRSREQRQAPEPLGVTHPRRTARLLGALTEKCAEELAGLGELTGVTEEGLHLDVEGVGDIDPRVGLHRAREIHGRHLVRRPRVREVVGVPGRRRHGVECRPTGRAVVVVVVVAVAEEHRSRVGAHHDRGL